MDKLIITTGLLKNYDFGTQSLLRLKEPAVLLRCRKEDLHLVEAVSKSAAQEYADKANVHSPEIIVDTTVFLPPPPTHHNPHISSWYGTFCPLNLSEVCN